MGGNAADASIAVAAALAVLEPCTTGLGGDMFALTYSAKNKLVEAVNGSGRSPAALTLEVVKKDCGAGAHEITDEEQHIEENFKFSAHAVTVPGAARGWEDLYLKHGSGKLSFAQLLEPAAKLAEEGFPVAPVTAHFWQSGMHVIKQWFPQHDSSHTIPLSLEGRAPTPGEIFCNPELATVLRSLGEFGATQGFYAGPPGKAIAQVLQKHGGVMQLDDLLAHESTFPQPIKVQYHNVNLWQVPPNGQGIAALVALEGLNALEQHQLCAPISPQTIQHSAASFLHPMIEMMRLGFADARAHVTDSDFMQQSAVENLLDQHRIQERARTIFSPDKAVVQGSPLPTSCTVSFQVVDREGNAVSFVNSNFMGFGTGIVPPGCGFTLQNRGFGFSLHAGHPNVVAPSKRPYRTIIPGMLTYADNSDLYATFSNMGGYMQPQGHFQLMLRMVSGELDPQEAIDMPRFCIADGTKKGKVFLEDGIPANEIQQLKQMGHDIVPNVSGLDRSLFGRAQIIKRDRDTGVLWAGSDGRADGCAMGY